VWRRENPHGSGIKRYSLHPTEKPFQPGSEGDPAFLEAGRKRARFVRRERVDVDRVPADGTKGVFDGARPALLRRDRPAVGEVRGREGGAGRSVAPRDVLLEWLVYGGSRDGPSGEKLVVPFTPSFDEERCPCNLRLRRPLRDRSSNVPSGNNLALSHRTNPALQRLRYFTRIPLVCHAVCDSLVTTRLFEAWRRATAISSCPRCLAHQDRTWCPGCCERQTTAAPAPNAAVRPGGVACGGRTERPGSVRHGALPAAQRCDPGRGPCFPLVGKANRLSTDYVRWPLIDAAAAPENRADRSQMNYPIGGMSGPHRPSRRATSKRTRSSYSGAAHWITDWRIRPPVRSVDRRFGGLAESI
jgi:hypothetical protein